MYRLLLRMRRTRLPVQFNLRVGPYGFDASLTSAYSLVGPYLLDKKRLPALCCGGVGPYKRHAPHFMCESRACWISSLRDDAVPNGSVSREKTRMSRAPPGL